MKRGREQAQARLTHRLIRWGALREGPSPKGTLSTSWLYVACHPFAWVSACMCRWRETQHSQPLLDHGPLPSLQCWLPLGWLGSAEINASCLTLALSRLCSWRLLTDFSELWQVPWQTPCRSLHRLQDQPVPLLPRAPVVLALRRFAHIWNIRVRECVWGGR